MTHLCMPWALIPNNIMNIINLARRVNCKIESYPKNLTAMFSLNSATLALMLLAAVKKCMRSWNERSIKGN